jgi:uncharacterized protein involved in type VI secretion and phage assembly
VSGFGSQLVLGIVTNNDDPNGMGRVRVKYPALGDDVEGAWARVASVSAGNARGLMMLPVVGEEVLVGFEHEDTTRPYVLGSLFNGVDVPGDDLLEGKDGSFALLSDHKIIAKSKEDMKLTSSGALTIDVTGDVTLTGSQGVTVKGQQLSIKADSDISIEGTSSVTIKCGASQIQVSASGVTVSGPMISLG